MFNLRTVKFYFRIRSPYLWRYENEILNIYSEQHLILLNFFKISKQPLGGELGVVFCTGLTPSSKEKVDTSSKRKILNNPILF